MYGLINQVICSCTMILTLKYISMLWSYYMSVFATENWERVLRCLQKGKPMVVCGDVAAIIKASRFACKFTLTPTDKQPSMTEVRQGSNYVTMYNPNNYVSLSSLAGYVQPWIACNFSCQKGMKFTNLACTSFVFQMTGTRNPVHNFQWCSVLLPGSWSYNHRKGRKMRWIQKINRFLPQLLLFNL